MLECIGTKYNENGDHKMKNRLNLSYTAVQAAYCMLFAVVLSFSSVYLLPKGYSNTEIGTILALVNIISVLLLPLFGDAADRSKKLSLAQITGIFSFILLFLMSMLFLFESRSATLTIIFVVLGGLMVSLSPIINSIAFQYSSFSNPINYGVARSGGSIAYSGISMLLGYLVFTFGTNTIPSVGVAVLVMLLFSLFTTEKLYNSGIALSQDEHGSAKALKVDEPISLIDFVKRNKMLFIFSLGTLLVFFQNAIINNYLFQIIEPIGGTSSDMGTIFSYMAILELPGLFFFDKINKKISCQTMLKISSAAFILKVFFTYTAKSVGLIYFAFAFQLISFPFYLASSVHLVHKLMDRREAVKGQSLISGMMTLSAVFASLWGGMVLDSGGPSQLLLLRTILCVLGSGVVIMTVGKIKSNK